MQLRSFFFGFKGIDIRFQNEILHHILLNFHKIEGKDNGLINQTFIGILQIQGNKDIKIC